MKWCIFFYKSIELSCHSTTCFVILPCCSIYDASACAVVIGSKSLSFKLIQQRPPLPPPKKKTLFCEHVIFNLYPHKGFFIVQEYHYPDPLPPPLTMAMHWLWNFCLQTPKKLELLELAEALSTELLSEELKWQALGELKEYTKCFL